MNTRKPLVSVIMPCHNCEDTIIDSINSVLGQQLYNFELIVVDDKSTDGTLGILLNLKKKDQRIVIIENKLNLGAGPSRNIAIKRSKGDYICFLDGDDYWLSDKLTKQINFMKEHNVNFSYTDFFEEYGGKKIYRKTKNSTSSFTLLFSNPIPCITVMYKKETYENIFQPSLRRAQDYGHWALMLNSGNVAIRLKEPLSVYRRRRLGVKNSIKVISSYIYIVRNFYQYGGIIVLFSLPLFLINYFFIKVIRSIKYNSFYE